MECTWKFQRGGGVFETKLFKGKYEAKLEFPEGLRGGGCSNQKPFCGGNVNIFWNNAIQTVNRHTDSVGFIVFTSL